MDSNIEATFLYALSLYEGRRFGDGESSAREREVDRNLRSLCEGIKKTMIQLLSWNRKSAEKSPRRDLYGVERETGEKRTIESGKILLTCRRIEAQRKNLQRMLGAHG